jgi:hypothetical protein
MEKVHPQMLPALLVYIGLLATLVGLVSLAWPLKRLGMTRARAASVCGVGVAVLVLGVVFPAPLVVLASRVSRLDDFMPAYQFDEVHVADVHASPEAIYAAIKNVTAGEIRLFRALTWMRSPHLRPTGESILAAPPDKPLLEVATRSGFLLLADVPSREVVFGTVGVGPPLHVTNPTPQDFLKFNRSGYAKIAMNFAIGAQRDGWSTVRTETRIYATDTSALRRFRAYWRVILPGSATIRLMWLSAIKKRAERES